MTKKGNKNYTNFDSYEFAEIRRYPYPVSATRVFYHAIKFSFPKTVSHLHDGKNNQVKNKHALSHTLPPRQRPARF